MCAQFTLNTTTAVIVEDFRIKSTDEAETISERFLPYKKAPVIFLDKEPKLVRMNFSLVPAWSKEPKVKFATHNARIESVTEKPTWRTPFDSKHCVVPMTGFYEAVYSGAEAGNVIQFHKPNNSILYSAGIYDFWKDKENPANSFYSFSILTTEPSPFIEEHGHDRSPIFLGLDSARSWLSLKDSPKEMVNFLLKENQQPDFTVGLDRPLKAGWEKRK